MRLTLQVCLLIILACCAVFSQRANKQFSQNGVTFEYPEGWSLQDDSNKDGQSITLARADLDVSINVYVHRGKITPEKMPDAKKAFIDPYVLARSKQFISSGAKPEQTDDSTEIAGQKAEGVVISASLGGEKGAARIYWTLVGQRVVLLTFFGPDKQQAKYSNVWDLVRSSIKVEDPKAAPKPSPE